VVDIYTVSRLKRQVPLIDNHVVDLHQPESRLQIPIRFSQPEEYSSCRVISRRKGLQMPAHLGQEIGKILEKMEMVWLPTQCKNYIAESWWYVPTPFPTKVTGPSLAFARFADFLISGSSIA
jgi:hypothetical protein